MMNTMLHRPEHTRHERLRIHDTPSLQVAIHHATAQPQCGIQRGHGRAAVAAFLSRYNRCRGAFLRQTDAFKYLSPKERIITVCAKGGGRSAQAAQVLRDMGFGRTWWLCGGTEGWA